ncbi:MAG: malate dehydrogenase [Actinobacteria bacterium]|nr:malate dehydrogenase [Actinomycetota bacterium]MCG2795718.1 malate dehydrogenase [Actinomycetes bacterium]
MDKVTIFGAGHVGATTAFYLSLSLNVEVALVDVEEGRARGLALDIEQSLQYTGSCSRLEGGADPGAVAESDLVIITAGHPRLPGMSRLDLTGRNAPIVTSIARETARWAPGAVVVVVTNPVDEMTYLTWKAGSFHERGIMGMAGVLDTSRFFCFLHRMAERPASDVEAMVLGTHGDDMVPLVDWSRAGGEPLGESVDPDTLAEVVERTRGGGAEIVSHLKSGSAYFAPAVSIGVMALAILGDTGEVLPVSAFLDGQYGISGIFLGVPARLGRGGVTEIVELPLSDGERRMLGRAAEGVRKRVCDLPDDFLR